MIEKFLNIRSVGKFRDAKAAGDVAWRKLTLVYAENGRGKTTLCAILRSLQTGSPEPITERKTLGVTAAPEVQLRLGGNTATFRNGAWDTQCPGLAIYDSTFIHENVYAGDYVDHEHKKNLYRVIVGEEGVRLARQVDELDASIKDLHKDIGERKAEVTKHVPSGLTVEQFLRLTPEDNLDDKIREKAKTVASLGQAAEIARRSALTVLMAPPLPEGIVPLLAQTLPTVAAAAEARVKAQITRHMDQHGEAWLQQGMGYVRDATCPFCGQGLRANDLIAAYQAFFSTEYADFKTSVANLGDQVTGALDNAALLAIQKTLSGNDALASFWKQFIDAELPDLSFDRIRTVFEALRAATAALLRRKLTAPLEAITTDAAFTSAMTEYEALKADIQAYNGAVEAFNASIMERKASTAGGDLATAQKDLLALQATKQRHTPEASEACRAYEDATRAKSEAERQKAEAKDRLDRYCEDVLQRYEQSINEYLDQFNAGFRITNTKHQYLGGTPSSQFQLVINDTAIDLGDARTPPGTPCFKSALSAGDRSALALAFFLACLKHDPNVTSKIVIFDDPFTSLDRFRRTCTQQLIRQQMGKATQVVVLSHDPYFLRLVWDGCPAADVKTLQLTRAADNTVVNEWRIEDETRSGYLQDHATLTAYHRDGTGDPRAVARTIRPLLEGHMRLRFPGHLGDKEWLGDFIQKIRGADAASPLYAAQAMQEQIEAINDFSKKYHHDQNPGADTEPIDKVELDGFVKRTLTLVGGY